ncbi:hypothetical protein ABPG72_012122 [Tetrahymena utriculariae]
MNSLNQDQLYFFVSTMVKNQKSAHKIYTYLIQAWGEVISLRRIQQLAKEFKDNERIETVRKQGSGRNKSAQNINLIRNLINEDNRYSLDQLSEETGIERMSVQRILNNDLQLKSLMCKWVPYNLLQSQKDQRVEECKNIMQYIAKLRVKDSLIVADEKWVYSRPVLPSRNNRNWIDTENPNQKFSCQARRTISDKKFLLIMASNFGGSMYYEVNDTGKTIDSQIDIQSLLKMLQNFLKGKLKQNLVLLGCMIMQNLIFLRKQNNSFQIKEQKSSNNQLILQIQICQIDIYSGTLNIQEIGQPGPKAF